MWAPATAGPISPTIFKMDWEYDSALDGNIALTAEIDLSRGTEFTLGVGFGRSPHHAGANLFQSLAIPFEASLKSFLEQWHRTRKRLAVIDMAHDKISDSAGALFARSINLLLAHEDKVYPGAMIASMSIPWGEDKGDDELGGYHLVWTRDMVQCASALWAAGDATTPLRALIYLAITQREDGGVYQNFWIDGRPYWTGVQLDEVAFPIIGIWRLWKANALGNFDPYTSLFRACAYLIREGPATAEERWEENGGYSPSTLAANIAALICTAEIMEWRGDKHTAEFVRTHADFLESHVEKWTVTNQGTLLPGVTRHYIRINPASAEQCGPDDEDPDCGFITLANQKPGDRTQYPANQIIDAGFLELVRFGIRRARGSAHRGLAEGHRCGAEGGHAVRPVLEALQPRWLRAAGGWHIVPRLGRGTCLAAADAGTCDLRTGCGSRHRRLPESGRGVLQRSGAVS